MKWIGPISALAFLAVCTPSVLANASQAQLLKQARVTKHQAQRIALAGISRGIVRSAELENEDGMLIWSVDVAQPSKKKLTRVGVDATTGKIASFSRETLKDRPDRIRIQ